MSQHLSHHYCKVGDPDVDQAHDALLEILDRLNASIGQSDEGRGFRELLGETMACVRRHYDQELSYVVKHLPNMERIYRDHYLSMQEEMIEIATNYERGAFLRIEDFLVGQIRTLIEFTFKTFCAKLSPAHHA